LKHSGPDAVRERWDTHEVRFLGDMEPNLGGELLYVYSDKDSFNEYIFALAGKGKRSKNLYAR